ncbi:MAG: flavodoxin family protein [Anaerolineae bacterium]|jgi:multimeric flavodoxin WrbA
MSRKQIVIVKGSPREDGNSAVLANQVAEGAREAGAQVESFYLHGMEINACDACDACHAEPYSGCIVEDDMQILYPKLLDANALVIASPIYWFTVSAQTKLFIDRCYALVDAEGYALRGRKVGIVLTYGDSDPFNSGAVNAMRAFQDAYAYVGAEIVGMVYGSADAAGEIGANEELMAKAHSLGKLLGAGD